MTSFETELVDLLRWDSQIPQVVGERIWPVAMRAQAVLPAITYGRESGGREYALDASVVRQEVTMVVRCWAHEYPAARQLAEMCAVVLDRATGVFVDAITVSDGADVYLEGLEAFGCTLVVGMRADWMGTAIGWLAVIVDFSNVEASQYACLA